MFEKEAKEYSNNWKINKNNDLNFAELVELRAVIYKANKDGAEFGYNKANVKKRYENLQNSTNDYEVLQNAEVKRNEKNRSEVNVNSRNCPPQPFSFPTLEDVKHGCQVNYFDCTWYNNRQNYLRFDF